jgi:Ca2+-binding RTX toxin-like protein
VTDVDGPSLSITALSVANGGGTVVDNHNGTFTYTPAANYNGPVSFNYTASDGSLTSTSTASLTLAAVNDAPIATPVTLAAGTEDTAYVINASTLLAGVTDVDGPLLSITALSVASGGGAVVDNHNGTFTYTPAANYNGPVSFNYTASDGSLSSSSTASLTLAAVNDAPVATPVTLAAGTEDTAYLINAATLLVGVTDVDGPSLSITALSVASGGGAVVDNHNGTFTYTPAANYNGPVSFNYTASDGSLTSSSTASLTLAAVNDAPVATPVTLAAGEENTAYNIAALTLLAGVTDVDGPFPLTVTSVSVASGGGTIVDNHDGTFSYTPAANYSGPVSFNYTASDGSLTSSSTASLNLNSSGVITGTPGADVLLGTSQADAIFGLGGNDRLQGFAGNDQLDGGTGFDRAIYSDATGGITVNLAAGTVSGPGVGTDTLVGIEGAVGSDFADTFNATGFTGDTSTPGTPIGFNEFEGRGGNDIINTAVNGFGAALTRVSYVSATAGVTVDIAAGTADGDASVGHDTFVGSGILSVFGSAFADTLSGSNNGFGTIEVFDGRAGNDTINGRGGFDRADYNNDPTTSSGITVHLAAGTVSGDATIGTDTLISVEAVRGTNLADVYDATGFSGSSTNAGSLGTFNEFTGEGGNDTIIGNGNTRLGFNNATAGVTVDIAAGTDSGDASVGNDTFTGVNAVMGSMFADSLSGSAGNETFTGLGGNDFIDGRGGFDTASYNNIYLSTGGVSVDLAAGTATGDSSIGTDTLRSIEGIQGTNAADTFVATGYGDPGALNVGNNGTFNQFEGLAGNDIITGNGFTRLLYINATGGVSINLQGGTATGDASVGSDTFTGVYSVTGSNFADVYDATNFNAGGLGLYNEFQGLAGNDTITGNGNTRLYYASATGGVSIDLLHGTATGEASVGSDTFSGVYSVMGSNFADVYNATGFTGTTLGTYNEFQGFAGNDTITGNGNTQIQYLSATAGVTVDMQAGTASGDASVGQDTFTGVNSVAGSNFNDALYGDSGSDFLSGFDGNDVLDGRGGNDVLTGGTGADTFVYSDGGGVDVITDFNRTEGDLIDVSGVSGIFSFADIQSRAISASGSTIIDFGGGNVLTLSNVATVQQSDFIFSNNINGTPGADVLLGTSQADAIFGLGGNDRLQGFAGNDQLDGGTGFDRAIYSDATGGITVNLAAGTVSGPGVGTDTLVGIEGAVGSDFADTFDATGFTGDTSTPGTPIGFNEFEGRGGNDIITGLTNSQGALLTRVSYVSATAGVNVNFTTDTADGDASVGHDTFIGAGVANVSGSAFADTLIGSNNPNGTVETFDGRAGNDFIDGGGGFDRADYNLDPNVTTGINVNLAAGVVSPINPSDTSIGTDTLRSIEAVRGTNFDDTYDATGFSGSSTNAGSLGTFNEFTGVGGNDTIIGNGNTRLSFNGATASVTFDIALGTAIGADLSIGTDHFSGVNAIQATMFNDTLLGSGNNETFTGLAGDDFIDGRGGFDTASYNNVYFTTGAVNVNMTTGDVVGDVSSGHDTLRSIEAVQGTNFADTYNATNFGAAGLDPNLFNVGNNGTFNQFEGLGGNDSITGNGNTRIMFTNATAGVSVNLQAGSATGDASVGHDTFTGVNSASGSNFADNLVATGFNGINGTFNSFQGLGGDDTVTGNGNTQIYFLAATAGVSINLQAGSAIGDASVGHDTFTGVNSASGSNFGDTFVASGFNGINGTFNSFQGLGGDDTITGNGNTQILFNNATAGVNVDLTTGNVNGDASVGHDTITGGVFNVLGSNFNDTISGTASNDTLNGGSGNDTISGRAGNDSLTGGTGADVFVYADAGGADTVTDFNRAEGDKIDVTGVSSVLSFADIQSRASLVGNNTVINFGGGNILTLNGVPNVQQSDFVFRDVDDRSILVTKGSGVVLTTADLGVGDSAGTTPANVVYTITATSHGSLQKSNGATSQTLNVNDSFSLDDIEHGLISFVTSDASYVGGGGFDVSVSVAGVPQGQAFVGASMFDAQITVLAASDYDFNQDDPAAKMGSSTNIIAPGYTANTFTMIDAVDNRDFIFVGNGFNTDGSGHPYSSGTIISIVETTDDPSHTPLARIELNVAALTWYDAVVAKASGDQSLLENLTRPWAINFTGNAGADAWDSGDVNDLFTGLGGNDTFQGGFGYDRAAYTHATGPIDVELAAGTVTDIGVNPTGIGQDTLRSVELVTATNYNDVYNATGFGANSTNAGSAVTANNLGLFNEFEGRGGDDQITGNGTTRISYYHATSGVTVTFNEGSWTGSSSGASGTAVGDASVGNDTFTGVYSVRGSFYNDTFTGSTNPSGTAENFEGLGGNDTINGGGGFDRAVYDNSFSGSGINVQLADGTVTPTNATLGAVDIGTDTLRSIEAVWGTPFDDIYNAGATASNPGGFSTTSSNAGSTQISATNPAPSNFNEFEGDGGNDTITGNGNTRVAYYHSTAGVVVTLGANGSGTADGDASVGHDTFISGVTRIAGSEFNDILTGNGGNNILDGRGGDDVLVGNGGNDTLTGGTGADIFVMKASNNVTDGNNPATNNDTITDFSHSDADRIDLSRIPSIHSLADVLSHASQVSSNVVIDFSYLALTDPTSLTIQNVTLGNLTASDFIFAGEVAVTVQTPDGYDFSTLYGDLAASNPIQPANNNATHVFAVDLAKGITFEMIGTGFTYDGTGDVNGGTITEIDVLNTTDPTQTTQDHVLVNTNGWSISAGAFVSDISQYASLDPATHAAGLTALNGIFNAATYSIVGTDGDGTADGRAHAGADVFFGGNQADVFNGMPGSFGPGDPGNDTVDYSHAGAAVAANLLTGSGSAGAAAGDIYISIENLRGSDFNDTLTGDGNNNVIEGGLGNDTLDGGIGGVDTVSYEHATDFVTVDLSKSVQQDTHGAGLDTLSNFETVLGSSFGDTLTGNGNSVLEGGPGDDHLIGQAGQNDTASYEHATSGVTVSLNIAGAQNTGGAGTDTLTNIASLFGSQFSDNLTGNNNANTLDGGFGGGNVQDTLTGMGGADKFVFNSGQVTITDFSEADHDLVDISHANNGSGFSDAQLAALLANSTGDTIDFGNGNVLTFANVTSVSAQLHSSDFLHT